jgi:hypothetical protein
MEQDDKNKISAFEKAFLDILAGGAGVVLAFVIWNMSLNLLMYHSLFSPRHLPEGTDLGGGFAFLITVPELLILLPVCTISLVSLLRKLR